MERSLEDESFRQRLLADPKGALEEELGTRLPEGVEVRTMEETADTIYLVLPSASPIGEDGELSDQELEAVAGSGIDWSPPHREVPVLEQAPASSAHATELQVSILYRRNFGEPSKAEVRRTPS